MIRTVNLIGRTLLDTGADFLESLVQEISIPQGQKRFLVYLDIRRQPLRLTLDFAELSEERLVQTLWVGNASAMVPQDRLTSSNLGYLISQTIPNLLRPGALPEGTLRDALRTLQDALYLDLGNRDEVLGEGARDPQYERYRFLWNLPLLGIADPELLPARDRESVEALFDGFGEVEFLSLPYLQAYARARGKSKEVVPLLQKVLEGWIEAQTELKRREIALYTLCLDGELLVQHPDYRRYLEGRLLEETFSGSHQGICHVCGERNKVTTNTTAFKLLKFYNTDKIGFASGLDDKRGFEDRYRICQPCYQGLLVGERFAGNQFRTRLAGGPVFVLPSFHLPVPLTGARLRQWGEYLRQRVSASRTLQGWHTFQQQLETYQQIEAEKNAFLIHFLFVRQAQSEVRILKLIADVPPSRLDALDEARGRVHQWADDHWGESTVWDLGLDRQFYLFPVRKRGNDPQNQLFLDYLDALLTAQKLRLENLLPLFLETAAMHRFERYGAYFHNAPNDSDMALTRFLMQSQLLLLYLDDLNLLIRMKGEGLMEVETRLLPEALGAQLEKLDLTPAQRALYLLGYLVGQVANAQYRVGRSKPVLEKIQFQGMDATKVVRLSNEIYEKLRQYKVDAYNEGVFAAMRTLLDQERSHLPSSQENTYWILSGHAFATSQALLHRSEEGESQTEAEESADQQLMEELS